MADFLTNLAMRIAEPLAVVRPRLPSMFEPSPLELSGQETSEAALQGEPPLQEIGREGRGAIEADADPAPAATIGREAPADTRFPGPVMPAAEPPRRSDQRIVPARQPREAHPDFAPPRRDAPADEQGPRPRATRAGTPPREPPANPRSSVGRTPSGRARAAEPEPRFEPARDAAPTRDRIGDDASDVAPEVSRMVPAVVDRPVAPVRPALVAPRTRFDAWGDLPGHTVARTESEPTIHVTIGRVEVRAVTAPPRAPAKPAPSPVMSLEDYLRTRAR